MTFIGYFDVFMLPRRVTLWPWPLASWPWKFYILCPTCPTHIPILIILWLSVNELRITVLDHIDHVTHHQGQNGPHFLKSREPNLSIHFQGATTNINPCFGENSVEPSVMAIKFTARLQYHVTYA